MNGAPRPYTAAMASRGPRIGLNGNLEQRGGVARLEIPLRYARAVEAAGGLPVGLFPLLDSLPEQLETLDGLLLTGGDDFDLERLGLGRTHPKAQPVPSAKQDFDWALARAALETGLPVLGICYGMQLLALVEGGSLLQHLPEDRPGAGPHGGSLNGGAVRHAVLAEPGTQLAELLGLEPVEIESRHHQAVGAVAAPWRVCARDGEGLIEAIERPGESFALGVQWHPDLQIDSSEARALFGALVQAAAAPRRLARAARR